MPKCEFCKREIPAGRFCTGFCAKKVQRIELGVDKVEKLGIEELIDN